MIIIIIVAAAEATGSVPYVRPCLNMIINARAGRGWDGGGWPCMSCTLLIRVHGDMIDRIVIRSNFRAAD